LTFVQDNLTIFEDTETNDKDVSELFLDPANFHTVTSSQRMRKSRWSMCGNLGIKIYHLATMFKGEDVRPILNFSPRANFDPMGEVVPQG
jgi:hypothetical protein